MNTRRAFKALVASAVLATSVTAFAEELNVGLASTSFANAAPRIAKELGLFDKRGLDPKFIVMDSANAAVTGVISKSIDAASAGPGEIVVAHARGQKVVVLVNTYAGFGGTLVLAKSVVDKLGVSPTAPVAQRLKALDGLVIGSPSATGAYTVTVKGAAAAAGATVRFAYMAQPAMLAAMESGAIQGFMGGAPFWAAPVLKGSGVAWVSGPKGEFPAEFTPANTANLQALRSYVDANPTLHKRITEVFADLTKAIDERPAEVKAVVAKLYPTVDAATLDLLFAAEARAWRSRPATAKDMAHEIAYIKLGGTPIPNIDSVDPAAMVLP